MAKYVFYAIGILLYIGVAYINYQWAINNPIMPVGSQVAATLLWSLMGLGCFFIGYGDVNDRQNQSVDE